MQQLDKAPIIQEQCLEKCFQFVTSLTTKIVIERTLGQPLLARAVMAVRLQFSPLP